MLQKYQIIYADPPWRINFPGGRTEAPTEDYPTMTTYEISRLPVEKIADDNCVLFLWGIWPKLPDAIEVMQAWGFKYKTVAFVWVKKNPHSLTEFLGMGNWTRSNTEFVLIGTKGHIRRKCSTVRQVVFSPVKRHSEKPAEVRDLIVQLMGDLPRVELFARTKAKGWHVWGNEVESDIKI